MQTGQSMSTMQTLMSLPEAVSRHALPISPLLDFHYFLGFSVCICYVAICLRLPLRSLDFTTPPPVPQSRDAAPSGLEMSSARAGTSQLQ